MESTLSLAKKDLEAEVGLHLGWGRGANFDEKAWTADKQNAIQMCVRSGLRQFYFPPPMEGVSYDWSFLKPLATLTLASGDSGFDLPDDFGGLEGRITVTDSNGQALWSFYEGHGLEGEGKIRQSFAAFPGATGRPEVVAFRAKKMLSELQGQRQELCAYPAADAAYTFQFRYYLLPNALNGDGAYAYGGMAHVETILESCLAIAEQRLDDKQAVHSAKFMERLAASINHDRRNKQQMFGYNGDRSDSRGWYGRRFQMDRLVTVAGMSP